MVLFPISLMFFAECDLFRLQYTPTKFCDPALSGCKVYNQPNSYQKGYYFGMAGQCAAFQNFVSVYCGYSRMN